MTTFYVQCGVEFILTHYYPFDRQKRQNALSQIIVPDANIGIFRVDVTYCARTLKTRKYFYGYTLFKNFVALASGGLRRPLAVKHIFYDILFNFS